MTKAARCILASSVLTLSIPAYAAPSADWLGIAATLPTVHYQLSPLPTPTTRNYARQAAMLDRLFAGAPGTVRRSRSMSWAAGDFTFAAEATRQRGRRDPLAFNAAGQPREGQWATGLRADWSLATDDTLTAGLATARDRRAEPDLLAGRPRETNTAVVADLAWTHAAWRLGGGWSGDSGGRRLPGIERLAQIAGGAPLHESGVHLTLARTLSGLGLLGRSEIGMEARDMTVAGDDAAAMGIAHLRDRTARLFLRVAL